MDNGIDLQHRQQTEAANNVDNNTDTGIHLDIDMDIEISFNLNGAHDGMGPMIAPIAVLAPAI